MNPQVISPSRVIGRVTRVAHPQPATFLTLPLPSAYIIRSRIQLTRGTVEISGIDKTAARPSPRPTPSNHPSVAASCTK